jgi:DNA-binding Lrp family transcriptional regulator
MRPNPLQWQLINRFQRNFPLEPRPYLRIADELGCSEEEVVARLRGLADAGVISRIGAVVRPHTVGSSTLAALRVPAERLEAVAAMVSTHPEVTHNYEREHAYNLWFVVTAADEAAVGRTLAAIEAETGLAVLALPLVRPFHIDLGFPIPCE